MFFCFKTAELFIALFNFSRSLQTKCVSLNNEPYMTRPTVIDLNPIELKYYPFMISLQKYKETCHTVDDLYTKI